MAGASASEKLKIFAARHVPGAAHLWNGYSSATNSLRFASSRLLRKLPGSSKSFGPPRHVSQTLQNWAKSGEGALSFQLLRPEGVIERPFPQSNCAIFNEQFASRQKAVIPPVFVGRLADARFVGQGHGAVISKDDTLLFDISRPKRNRGVERHDLLGALKLPPLTEAKGRIANLVTPEAEGNYYHWLVELMPRFFWLREAGFDMENLDGIILKHRGLPFQKACLKIVGVDEARILQAHPRLHLRAEELIISSYINYGYNSDAYSNRGEGLRGARDWMRSANPYLAAGKRYPTKIYVSRQRAAYRRAVNGSEFETTLNEFGFATIFPEDLSFEEQVALFSGATHIVGLNGAGLANMIFAPEGTKVIECVHPDFITSYFWDICAELGHQYYVLVSNDARRGPAFFKFAQQADVTVDCKALRELLASIS